MLWRPLHRDGGMCPGDRFRLEHSLWLTRALRGRHDPPRIPLRRADRGGFDRLMSTHGGRLVAERWWSLAMERVELSPRRARRRLD